METPQILNISDKDIEVLHKVDLKYGHFKMHIHSNYEIFFSQCDRNSIFVGKNIFECNKNDVFLFDDTDMHKLSTLENGEYDRYVLSFAPEIVRPISEIFLRCFDKRRKKHTFKISLTPQKAQNLKDLFDRLIAVSNSKCFAKQEKKFTLLCQILLFINDERIKMNPSRNIEYSENDKFINDIIYYINQNFTKQITLEAISKNFYTNKYHVCRVFKTCTGFGISEYINNCRIAHATPMLEKGLTILEVALKCGFGSYTYFISMFKKVMGTSPKQYYIDYRQKQLQAQKNI